MTISGKVSHLKQEYIETNRKFQDGDKVVVITPAGTAWKLDDPDTKIPVPEKRVFAFVVGYKVNYKHEVEPVLVKCKKDGTPSKMVQHFGEKDIIEKANAN